MIYHVSPKGNNFSKGTKEQPFKTISHAAKIAVSGDTVIVHEGVYREYVDPKNGGINEYNRIVYTVAEGERAVIKGSEIISNWKKVKGTVWKATISNEIFGDWNPYAIVLDGDWRRLDRKIDYPNHLGDVYINGVSAFEAIDEKDLYSDEIRYWGAQYRLPEEGYLEEQIPNPERTLYRWLAEVNNESTTIYVNFRKINPNENLIEINVRECCFYPSAPHKNYITVRGFEMCHAACPFSPPTSDQKAMLGVNWSKGWIIENNILHDAKCSAISLGKEASTGNNDYTKFLRKYSHYYQLESVFKGLQFGWNGENIGSHIIRNNEIYECGQNAIVGNLGSIFSRIEHNHIHHICTKHEFFGHEIGGIKLHAAIDVIIENNCIHDCVLGTWLDWEAQGTRITKNLYYDNNRDFFIEVTHGPCTVDNNIFLSTLTIQNAAQGTAFVHNVLGGTFHLYEVSARHLPYHFPHSTAVLGVARIYNGDDRILNNINLCLQSPEAAFKPLSEIYPNVIDGDEYYANQQPKSIYEIVPQPLWIDGNAYAKECIPHSVEKRRIIANGLTAKMKSNNTEWNLVLNVPNTLLENNVHPVTTASLGMPIFTEQPYENKDGSSIDFTIDMLYNKRSDSTIAGPFATLKEGINVLTVWKK